MVINISDGKGPSGGFLGRSSAQKQYFPKSMFIPKMSVGRSCVKLNYSSFSREHTLACSAHFNDTVALFSFEHSRREF